MQAHAQVNELQYHGSSVLSNVCAGDHAAARARQLQAANAGGVEALVGAMEAHEDEYLQESCCGALRALCRRSDSVAARALQAGGRRAVAAAMQACPGNNELQDYGQELLDLFVE